MTIFGSAVLWLGGLYVFRRSALYKAFFIISSITALFILLAPGSSGNAESVRNAYVDSLLGYEGVRYIGGGENWLGIDCSGLVREGYIGANIKVGLETINPRLLRRAASVWWYDCAADALGNGYKGMTGLVMPADSMDKLDYKIIEPGDIIVPENGSHTFVYIGGDTWLEADPAKGGVVRISTADRAREWSDIPVRLMRWSDLRVRGTP
jgi:cell wall-associated NlpC family hydrolase